MKLNLSFPNLERVRQKMGAPMSTYFFQFPAEVYTESKEVFRDDLTIHPKGVLLLENQPIVLYIYRGSTGKSIWPYKYHFTECSTIRSMTTQGRRSRYHASARKDGDFYVSSSGSTKDKKLITVLPCKNCINAMSLNYQERNYVGMTVKTFSLPRYYEVIKR